MTNKQKDSKLGIHASWWDKKLESLTNSIRALQRYSDINYLLISVTWVQANLLA